MTVRDALALVMSGQSLSAAEAEAVMNAIMAGDATDAQIAALLVALRLKGETIDEITGFARAMRENAIPIPTKVSSLVDVCGTGGDARGTFNISTAVAFVASGAGLTVAKHGNRSISSRCGSADVLEALGVRLDLSPENVGRCIDEIGIGFLFAPVLHPAMKHAIAPRREMGIRTVFNVLGPLTNPARTQVQLLGVYEGKLTEPLAHVLRSLGCRSAFVVHGAGGMDEVSTLGETFVTRLGDDNIESFAFDPASVGIPRASLADFQGGDAKENAGILSRLLRGESGPKRDIVLLNAAFVLVAAGGAADIGEGVAVAAESIDSGTALGRLDALIAMTERLGGNHDP